MNPPASSPHTAEPSRAPDPVLQGALAELLQLGLVVARVSSRLAEMEGRAVEALAEAAVASCDVVGTQASLADAIEAGQRADASDAARDLIVARVVIITATFEKAARAVRRTAALQARLADGRGFRERPRADREAAHRVPGGAGLAARAANDAERAERGDAPEWGGEIDGMSDEDVVRAIRRDLDRARTAARRRGGARSVPPLAAALHAPGGRAATPGMRPRIGLAVPNPPGPAGVLPAPDT